MRIYLIGLMGCGKTTVGKKLANKLSLPFIDLDQLIEEQVGISISDYFSKFGEENFRKIEQQALRNTFCLAGAVIATGGGTPCSFQNMDEILQNGISIYLKADVNFLCSRLTENKHKRPLISQLDEDQMISFLENLLEQRQEFYQKALYTAEAMDITPEKLISFFNFK